ncbi:hypothetical protein SEVIR_7G044200v4 [Setaria viridis]|uniref:NB-ARC domain-containing protein n=2 Tax=Setaria viridis TaxID=4556 RepID=A0A4U6TKD8_SETVI|nr:hypothetical protein SEVIR_7G044200v2 [Setaria viridis]
MRYNLTGDSAGSSHSISKPAEQPATTASPSAFHILREVWEAAGKLHGMGDLRELITGEGGDDLQVISVWGSTGGDLGARSMIMETYCHGDICDGFKSRAWVKLVQPFNPNEFLKSLLTQLCRRSWSSHHQADAGEVEFRTRMKAAVDEDDHLMKAELMQQLMKHKRYLVVLEDVSTVVEWDDIKMLLPDCKNGSRIIVSTHDIGMAFMCTGKPYLVSELRRFPDGHSLCALFRKVPECPIDVGKLKQQMRYPGVISVYGSSRTNKSILIKKVCRNILDRQKELDGLEFEKYGWAYVPAYWFDLSVISRQLYLDLASGGLTDVERESINGIVDDIEEADLIQRCCKLLREKVCLVVINGLRSTKDWDLFKASFLSEHVKGCIIVITNEANVAKHCVNHEDRVFNIKDHVQASVAEYCGIRDSPDEIFSTRREEAHGWTKTFQLVSSRLEVGLDLFLQLQEPGDYGVVSVWGIAAVGKSDIVRTCYYHHMLNTSPWFRLGDQYLHFDLMKRFAKYSWVRVPHPFNLTEFSRRLLVDFYSDDLQAMETVAVGIMQGQDLIEECRKLLRQENYFVVVEGLGSTDAWDSIKEAFFPQPVDGCIVVIITNEASVARHCQVKEQRRVNVKGLQADEAHNLFIKVAWDNKPTPDNMELSKTILSKCGGLPKIITAIGEYCKSSTERLKHINDDFIGSLETEARGFRRLRRLFSWMQFYFDYACSDTLKPCIFYLLVFPVDHNIRQRRLLRRWIAEGYSRDKASTTADEEGRRLFSDLIDLSIIQVQDTPSETLHQQNGFLQEYIVSRPMEDNLVFTLEGHCTLSSQRAGKHLTIRSSWDRDKVVFESIDFSRLRSLTVFGKWRSFFVSANTNMRLLRVLDLEDTSGVTDDDLGHIAKLLPRLKFLSLRGCREITYLPNSLGGLRQLQTLDVKHTSIVTLPPVITKLEKLQYINAGTTEPIDDLTSPAEAASGSLPAAGEVVGTSTPPPWSSRAQNFVSGCLSNNLNRSKQQAHDSSVKVPAGIGRLTMLQTLGVVNVGGAGRKAISNELKMLTQLRKLGVSGINQGNYQKLFSAISDHAHLVSLSVRLDKDKEGAFCCLDGISKPPKTLKSLKLYGHVHKLPDWMRQLDNLSKVDLEITILTQKDTRFYEQFPSQSIHGRVSVKPIQVSQVHFGVPEDPPCRPWTKQFRIFKIDCTTRLQANFGEDYITSSVQLLVVHCSSGSSLQISGLEHLLVLKEVWLKGSYSYELWQQLKQQLSEHPKKPVLKPEIPPFVMSNEY